MRIIAGTTQTSAVYGAYIGAFIAGAGFYEAFYQGLRLQGLSIILLPMGVFLAATVGAICAVLGAFAKRIVTAAIAGAVAMAIPFVFLLLGSYFEYFPPFSYSRGLKLSAIITLIGLLAGAAGGLVARTEIRKKRASH